MASITELQISLADFGSKVENYRTSLKRSVVQFDNSLSALLSAKQQFNSDFQEIKALVPGNIVEEVLSIDNDIKIKSYRNLKANAQIINDQMQALLVTLNADDTTITPE